MSQRYTCLMFGISLAAVDADGSPCSISATVGDGWEVLAEIPDQLDGLARSINAPALGDFVSYTAEEAQELCAFLKVDPKEARLVLEQWFRPADGWLAVRRLISHVNRNQAAIPKRKEVIFALMSLAGELARADREGLLFRFYLFPAPDLGSEN